MVEIVEKRIGAGSEEARGSKGSEEDGRRAKERQGIERK